MAAQFVKILFSSYQLTFSFIKIKECSLQQSKYYLLTTIFCEHDSYLKFEKKSDNPGCG